MFVPRGPIYSHRWFMWCLSPVHINQWWPSSLTYVCVTVFEADKPGDMTQRRHPARMWNLIMLNNVLYKLTFLENLYKEVKIITEVYFYKKKSSVIREQSRTESVHHLQDGVDGGGVRWGGWVVFERFPLVERIITTTSKIWPSLVWQMILTIESLYCLYAASK